MSKHFEIVDIMYDYDDRSIPWVVASFSTLKAAKNYVIKNLGYRFQIECFNDSGCYAVYFMLTDKTFVKDIKK